LPDNLLESMLFGHKKGSFTGASDHQTGLVKSAHGGTLFLDEIGELPEALQPKLLRFLETRKMLRLGDTSEQAVDVRVVAATNRRLEDAVRASRFREDLYYRLNVLRLESLPLRLRMEEVPSLAQFVAEAEGARLTVGALTLLTIHDWPGNVRQLRNVVSRARAEVGAGATVITRSMVAQALASDLGCAIAEIAPPHLQTAALGPQFVRLDSNASMPGRVAASEGIPVVARDYPFMRADGSLHPGMDLGEAEREFQVWQMARALERCDNAKSKTARYLGMNLQTFLVRARKHGLIKEAEPAAGGRKSPDPKGKSKRRPRNSD
jgi:transcriptional regulator with PAS, ATPase and Fis domain